MSVCFFFKQTNRYLEVAKCLNIKGFIGVKVNVYGVRVNIYGAGSENLWGGGESLWGAMVKAYGGKGEWMWGDR